MTWSSEHVKWLVDTGELLKTKDGTRVGVWEFRYDPTDEKTMSLWAKHFRNHYCLDADIDKFRSGTGYSRQDYLNNLVFPDAVAPPGPSIRSGDFCEVLTLDFLQFVLGYWVPRTRYANKSVRNESTKGCDVIGIRFHSNGEDVTKDTIAIFEVKAQLTTIGKIYGLQLAINDSAKDEFRKGMSLNALKRQFLQQKNRDDANKIERFQNPLDQPYMEISGAAAVFSTEIHNPTLIAHCDASAHRNHQHLYLIVFHSPDLMPFINNLYRKAGNEA